ncbi:MAG: hypothetical protein ACM3ZS_08330, partial [Nitrososphaerota archaeon]
MIILELMFIKVHLSEERDFDIIIAEDGVSAFSKKDHVFGLKYMKENYGAKIKKTSQIIRDI